MASSPDNTTTAYTDNLADAALGAAAPTAAVGGVVTAARSFTVNNTFQVINATLGAALPPI